MDDEKNSSNKLAAVLASNCGAAAEGQFNGDENGANLKNFNGIVFVNEPVSCTIFFELGQIFYIGKIENGHPIDDDLISAKESTDDEGGNFCYPSVEEAKEQVEQVAKKVAFFFFILELFSFLYSHQIAKCRKFCIW